MTTSSCSRRSVSAPRPSSGRGTRGTGTGSRNGLTAAALAVEPRLARWRDALGDLAGAEPTLAGSGSTWFVEGGPAAAGTASAPALVVGDEAARLVRAHTVPAGWEGD